MIYRLITKSFTFMCKLYKQKAILQELLNETAAFAYICIQLLLVLQHRITYY